MNVIRYDSLKKLAPSVLILGAFDAIHNGHLQLINNAKKFHLPISITLFDSVNLIPSKKTSWQYSSLNIKLQQLSKLGINNVILVQFEQIQNLPGVKFVNHLVNLTNATKIIVGKNFVYGKNRQNNVEDLKNQFPNTLVIPDFKKNNKKISTSFLKELIILGEVDLINELSPFPYTQEVNVKNHQVIWDKHQNLAFGVYAVFVIIHQIRYCAVLYHFPEKSLIYVKDFINQQNYEALIFVISLIRLSEDSKEIINVKDNFSKDLLNSKNKLISYLKNHI